LQNAIGRVFYIVETLYVGLNDMVLARSNE
jgi:hypothetical protein